jgi:hypothetical protein
MIYECKVMEMVMMVQVSIYGQIESINCGGACQHLNNFELVQIFASGRGCCGHLVTLLLNC